MSEKVGRAGSAVKRILHGQSNLCSGAPAKKDGDTFGACGREIVTGL
jgi:hypothetical protein